MCQNIFLDQKLFLQKEKVTYNAIFCNIIYACCIKFVFL